LGFPYRNHLSPSGCAVDGNIWKKKERGGKIPNWNGKRFLGDWPRSLRKKPLSGRGKKEGCGGGEGKVPSLYRWQTGVYRRKVLGDRKKGEKEGEEIYSRAGALVFEA